MVQHRERESKMEKKGERDAQLECSCALGKTRGSENAKSGNKPGGAKHVATFSGNKTKEIKCTF